MFPTESFPVFCEKATQLVFCNNAQPWSLRMEYKGDDDDFDDDGIIDVF